MDGLFWAYYLLVASGNGTLAFLDGVAIAIKRMSGENGLA
jgi:hypothetical protein